MEVSHVGSLVLPDPVKDWVDEAYRLTILLQGELIGQSYYAGPLG
jgi:hypothetical protein